MGNCGVGFAPVRERPGRRADQADGRRGGHSRRRARRRHPLELGELSAVHGRARRDAAQPRLPAAGSARPGADGGDGRARLHARRPPATTTSRRCARWCARRCRPARPASAPAAATTTAPSEGKETPAAEADRRRAVPASPSAFEGLGHGVIQMVSDFDLLKGPERFDAEFDLVEQMARASGRPLSMTWLQRDPGGEQWQAIRERVDARRRCRTAALPAGSGARHRRDRRARGELPSVHGLSRRSRKSPRLPLAAARRGDARAGAEGAGAGREVGPASPATARAIPPLVDILLARIELISGRMFPLGENPDYEPSVMQSFLVRAKQRGVTALEALYDHLAEGDGENLIYFPIFNYNDGTLAAVREHARASARARRPERRRRARRHGLRRELLDLHADPLGAGSRRATGCRSSGRSR